MKWYQNEWFCIWVITLVLGTLFGVGYYYEAYDTGYSQGYSDTPRNVIEVERVEITKEDGLYHFTIITGNTTFSVAEMPSKSVLSPYKGDSNEK